MVHKARSSGLPCSCLGVQSAQLFGQPYSVLSWRHCDSPPGRICRCTLPQRLLVIKYLHCHCQLGDSGLGTSPLWEFLPICKMGMYDRQNSKTLPEDAHSLVNTPCLTPSPWAWATWVNMRESHWLKEVTLYKMFCQQKWERWSHCQLWRSKLSQCEQGRRLDLRVTSRSQDQPWLTARKKCTLWSCHLQGLGSIHNLNALGRGPWIPSDTDVPANIFISAWWDAVPRSQPCCAQTSDLQIIISTKVMLCYAAIKN